MDSREKVSGGLFVARCDSSELFEEIEEFFDQIALAIEREVAMSFGLAV